MRATRLTLAGGMVLALLAGAAVAEYRLSDQQILAHVSGNTLQIVTKNLEEAVAYFNPDGTAKGLDGGRDFSGSWKVEDDMLCLDLPQFEGQTRCRRVFVRGDEVFLFTTTGEPAGSLKITKGNPRNF